jgi:hypothetical protein
MQTAYQAGRPMITLPVISVVTPVASLAAGNLLRRPDRLDVPGGGCRARRSATGALLARIHQAEMDADIAIRVAGVIEIHAGAGGQGRGADDYDGGGWSQM